MPLWKSFFAVVFNVRFTAFWMTENESKRRLFKWNFTFGNKSNQQVLNLAKTEGGRAQSLFVEPRTAWRLSPCIKVCGTKHEQIFRFSISSTTIFLTVSLPMFTSRANILSEKWRFWSNSWEIVSTLLSLQQSVGRPLLESPSIFSCPSGIRLYHRKAF